jgi:D-amino-acid dehydrogenase
MLRGGGPLAIRPTLDPTFLRWLLAFRRSATRGRWEQGVRALIALNARTLELFDSYTSAGVQFEMHRSGLVLVASTPAGLASYTAIFRDLRSLGFGGDSVELSPGEAKALEPALAAEGLAGGVHALVDRYVRPESLVEGLASALADSGVQVLHAAVEGIEADGGRVRLRTDGDPIEAERVVVAAGASSPPLLARLGIRLPLVGARGYSFTFSGGAMRPSHALYLAEAKVGISAYSDSVRIAGVFELGYTSDAVHRRRLAAIALDGRAVFRGLAPERGDRLARMGGPTADDCRRAAADREGACDGECVRGNGTWNARRHAGAGDGGLPRAARPGRSPGA